MDAANPPDVITVDQVLSDLSGAEHLEQAGEIIRDCFGREN